MVSTVRDLMTRDPVTLRHTATLSDAAIFMAQQDIGDVIVETDGVVCGLVTDRDIVVRVVAKGGSADSAVREVMTEGAETCRESDNLADAAAAMASRQIRRLVVLNEAGALAGILSLGDIAVDYGAKVVGQTLEEISAAPATH